ncbi:hypothetical protein LCGC14_2577250, partial [marine sediment metagenome]
NPTCETEIPLMRQFWLAKKSNKKVAMYLYIKNNKVEFKIVGTNYAPFPQDFNPTDGTVSRAIATCPVCNSVIAAKDVRKQFQEGKGGQRMIVIVLRKTNEKGKLYRLPTEEDRNTFVEAENYLKQKRKIIIEERGFDPIPNENLPPAGTLGFRVQRYGILKWGNLFNSRQKLTLITYIEKIRQASKNMLEQGYDEEYSKAILSYLALGIDRLADQITILVTWLPTIEAISHTFVRQALPMKWDYIETNSFSGGGGSYKSAMNWILRIIEHCAQTISKSNLPTIVQTSATSLPYPDNYFDAIFTDPPYYDNVPYSHLSDFFYVWLKRSIGDLYPELFSTPLSPKSEEIVAYTHEKSWDEAKEFFENMLKKALKEIYRVLKTNGIAIIIYAHKTTAGWESVINALLDSGLMVSASWPISTERKVRLRAKESAALASSIYIIVRKIKKKENGLYPEIKKQMKKYLNIKLERIWQE